MWQFMLPCVGMQATAARTRTRRASRKAPSGRLVVTCTDRKSVPPHPSLRARSLRSTDPDRRVKEWLSRLRDAHAEGIRASDLYRGEHWTVVRSMRSTDPTSCAWSGVWIASAGYGLIPWEAELKSYSATFALGHQDSVVLESVGARTGGSSRWWMALSNWGGPVEATPRTLAQLAQLDPSEPLLVVASAAYLRAMESDLVAAQQALAEPDLLLVVSAGTRSVEGIGASLLPVDGRFQRVVGGSLLSLNVRVARWIAESAAEHRFRLAALTHMFAAVPPLHPMPRRTRMSDDEINRYIADALYWDANASRSTLLRALRNQGLACEQRRFACLFERARDSR